jgi:hypothetical protein
MRLGSVAAAPFVGDQFASLYLGATRVPTVPGKPVIAGADLQDGIPTVEILPPLNDGGSEITDFLLFLDGVADGYESLTLVGTFWVMEEEIGGILEGQLVQVAAVNAVGAGPLSDPFAFEN